MATPARKIVVETLRKSGVSLNGSQQDVALVDVISAVNEAIDLWFYNRASKAERDRTFRDDLRVFEKKHVKLSKDETASNSRADVFRLPSDLFMRLNQYATIQSECCKGISKDVPMVYVQSDDLNPALRNPLRKPSFAYEQVLCSEAGNSLYVYHLDDFQVKEVFLDYYRPPIELHAPSLMFCGEDQEAYYDYEGTKITTDTVFEPNNRAIDHIITDIASILVSENRGDYQRLQAKIQSILALSNNIHTY